MANPLLQPLGYDVSGATFDFISKTWLLQRNFYWSLYLPYTINGVIGTLISPFCQEANFGLYSLSSTDKINHGAFQRFYAGLQSIDSVKLGFVTSIDNAVLDYFNGWYNLMLDKKGYYHPKQDYAKDIYIALFDRTGIESIRFNLKGCFVKNLPGINISYISEDLLKLSVELSVDDIEMSSLIGSIRGAITNVIGDVARSTKEILGNVGGSASGRITSSGNITQ